MSVILVADQDASHAERISEVLRSNGLEVETVGSRTEALRRAEALAPRLLLASSTFPEAEALFAAFSRTRGGPGAVVLTGVDHNVSAADFQADEVLPEPFSDNDLWQLVKHCLEQAPTRQSTTPRSAPNSEQLTSADIFGDVLAEVEAEAKSKQSVQEIPVVPDPMDDIERRLEETLSGVIPPPGTEQNEANSGTDGAASKVKPEKPSESEIDDLLEKTLSFLDIPTRPKKPAASPSRDEATESPSLPAETGESNAVERSEQTAVDPADISPVVESTEAEELTFDLDAQNSFDPLPAIEPTTTETEAELTPKVAAPEAPKPATVLPLQPELAKNILSDVGATLMDLPSEGDQFRTQAMPMLIPSQDMAAGENFGDYTLLDRIAMGGMAEVWRARRKGVEGFQKTVAIKKILSHLTGSPDFVTMFIDEAKLAAQLSHNNIIQIYDLGKVGNDFFIAMEYVEGKDLRSILAAAEESKRPIPIGLGLLTISAVARALDYAHRKRDFEHRALGLVHRDVSPQNVLLSYEGEIKLCDFGIVKAVAKASTTQMGALKGKLQYMSPEQAWGKSVDARSDIFSLGTVLYEVLTGTKLFSGDSEIGVLDAVRECRIRSPRELVPEIPKQVEHITLKALAKKPDERYQTAGEMEQELKAVMDGLKPTPSPKDLATYLNSLYSPQEQAASNADSPTSAEALTNSPVAAEPVSGSAVQPSSAVTGTEKGSRLKWVIAAVLATALAGVAFLILSSRGTGSPTTAGDSAPSSATGTEVSPTDSGSDPSTPTASGSEDLGEVQPAEHVISPENTTSPGNTAPSKETDPAPIEAETTTSAANPAEITVSTQAESADAEQPSTAPGLNLEQMVNEELENRAERLRRDFEAERKRLEKELSKTRSQNTSTDETVESDESGGGDAQKDKKEEGHGGSES